jgi:hypothetical protein
MTSGRKLPPVGNMYLFIERDTLPMGDEDPDQDDSATRFLKGLVLAVGILALSCLLIFLPIVGPLLLFTVAPFVACYYAVRLSGLEMRRGWLWLGLSAGAIISAVESSVVLSVVGLFGAVDLFEPVGLTLLCVLFLANISFGALGARRAAASS